MFAQGTPIRRQARRRAAGFNNSRGCVKTVLSKFGNDQFCDMRYVVEVSRRIRWSKNEFSYSLSPEPTPMTLLFPPSRLTRLAAVQLLTLGGFTRHENIAKQICNSGGGGDYSN
jgi:hypothetical protein